MLMLGYKSVVADAEEIADTAVYEGENGTITIDTEENVPNEEAAENMIEEANEDIEETKQETDADLQEEDEAAAGYAVEDAEIDAYLADSVIIGDSIVLGYRNYCTKS